MIDVDGGLPRSKISYSVPHGHIENLKSISEKLLQISNLEYLKEIKRNKNI